MAPFALSLPETKALRFSSYEHFDKALVIKRALLGTPPWQVGKNSSTQSKKNIRYFCHRNQPRADSIANPVWRLKRFEFFNYERRDKVFVVERVLSEGRSIIYYLLLPSAETAIS
jgi:hypothetical protein